MMTYFAPDQPGSMHFYNALTSSSLLTTSLVVDKADRAGLQPRSCSSILQLNVRYRTVLPVVK